MKRPQVITLLAQWDDASLVPRLRDMFGLFWQVEQKLNYRSEVDYGYYDAIAYVLGQRGGFGALTGLCLPTRHLNMAYTFMAFGALHPNTPLKEENMFLSIAGAEAKSQVAAILGQRFGFSEEEQEEYVNNYYLYENDRDKYGERLRQTEGRQKEEDEEQEDADDEGSEEVEVEAREEKEPEIVQPQILVAYQGHSSQSSNQIYSQVYSLGWSPDGTRLLSAGEDATVHVWDAKTGIRYLTFARHTAAVLVAAWSPQGTWIASGGADNQVFVWDAQTGDVLTTYQGHASYICRGLTWSPNGTQLASGSWDGTVQVWNAFSGERVLTYTEHRGVVTSVAWSLDGAKIVSGGGYPECLIHVWSSQTGETLLTYRGHTEDEMGTYESDGQEEQYGASSVHSLVWSANEMRIASGGLRNSVQVWDARTGKKDIVSHDEFRLPLASFPDGTSLLSGASDNRIARWHATTGEVLVAYRSQGMYQLEVLSLSPDGTQVAAVGWKSVVYIWNV